MQPNLHPEYRFVLFQDTSCGKLFRLRSSAPAKETMVWEEDGQEYPLVRIEVSSESHPFYTGQQRLNQADGRVAKFQQRFGAKRSLNNAKPPESESAEKATRGKTKGK